MLNNNGLTRFYPIYSVNTSGWKTSSLKVWKTLGYAFGNCSFC
jgi:hypothetical protein